MTSAGERDGEPLTYKPSGVTNVAGRTMVGTCGNEASSILP